MQMFSGPGPRNIVSWLNFQRKENKNVTKEAYHCNVFFKFAAAINELF